MGPAWDGGQPALGARAAWGRGGHPGVLPDPPRALLHPESSPALPHPLPGGAPRPSSPPALPSPGVLRGPRPSFPRGTSPPSAAPPPRSHPHRGGPSGPGALSGPPHLPGRPGTGRGGGGVSWENPTDTLVTVKIT